MSEVVSLRSRLGGRRALSWQAVVLGSFLMVILATALAATSSGERRGIDAAVDVFAITMATSVVVALYSALAHATVFRNRSTSPVSIPLTLSFHLSIGVLFLFGFAVGAALLVVPRFGGSALFSVAVLLGGLAVCVPTSLLLDHSDRYRTERATLIEILTDLEFLRISEWSIRRSLKGLVEKISGDEAIADVLERLNALDASSEPFLSTERWWKLSAEHHASSPIPQTFAQPIGVVVDKRFHTLVDQAIADDFPLITWKSQVRKIPATRPTLAGLLAIATVLTVGVALSVRVPASQALIIAGLASVSVVVVYSLAVRTRVMSSLSPWVMLVVAVLLSDFAALAMAFNVFRLGDAAAYLIAGTSIGVVLAVAIVAWISAVIIARAQQVDALTLRIESRSAESAAILSSLTAIITRMAEAPALSGSAAVAACAVGLQRVDGGVGADQARRILDWTESVISAPGLLPALSLEARIEEAIHPWRALVVVDVEGVEAEGLQTELPPNNVEEFLAQLDKQLGDACRLPGVEHIRVRLWVDNAKRPHFELLHDGVPAPHSH